MATTMDEANFAFPVDKAFCALIIPLPHLSHMRLPVSSLLIVMDLKSAIYYAPRGTDRCALVCRSVEICNTKMKW